MVYKQHYMHVAHPYLRGATPYNQYGMGGVYRPRRTTTQRGYGGVYRTRNRRQRGYGRLGDFFRRIKGHVSAMARVAAPHIRSAVKTAGMTALRAAPDILTAKNKKGKARGIAKQFVKDTARDLSNRTPGYMQELANPAIDYMLGKGRRHRRRHRRRR